MTVCHKSLPIVDSLADSVGLASLALQRVFLIFVFRVIVLRLARCGMFLNVPVEKDTSAPFQVYDACRK